MKKLLLVVLILIGLQTQAQQSATPYFCCDSITYWTDQNQGFNIGLYFNWVFPPGVHNPDSINVYWQICNSSQCYGGTGIMAYFPQIITTDTIKACYDVYIHKTNSVEICTHCDSLVFDQNTYSWVLFSIGNPTSINELTFNRVNDNKIYDMLGREVTKLQTGVIYIKNGKKYILSE